MTGKPIGVRLFRIFLIALAGLLGTAIVLTGILVLVDVGQRRRILHEQSALSGGGSYLEVNGTLVHFRRAGLVPDPLALVAPKPPLVLIHGLMGSSMDFEYVQPALASDRTVIAVDLIGFGLSDKSTALDYSKRSMAETIAGLMNQLGFSNYDVLGHSMGGEVALHLALNHPEQVDRLILLDSAGLTADGAPGANSQNRQTRLPPWLIEVVFKNTLLEKAVFKTCLYNPDPFMPLAFEKLYYFVQQIPAETLAKFIADSDSGSVAGRLSEIRQKTRIIWGEQDRIISLSQGHALAAAIPGSQLQAIGQCGHLPYLEKPEELVRLVQDFLAD